LYSETELYRSAVRVYTKPLFQWRKAFSSSTDGKTLYDFAARGLRGLDELHRALRCERFAFRPALALHYNFNGKHRTLYVAPWEERIVDLLLYRALNRRLDTWFSPNSYAYRERGFGLDACQAKIARTLDRALGPLYLVKRDIANYFASVDHELLLQRIRILVDSADYLYQLVEQRIRFLYEEDGEVHQAHIGIPFGTAVACVMANTYLTGMDREIEAIPDVAYFRYADDLLLASRDRDRTSQGAEALERALRSLKLATKQSHSSDIVLAGCAIKDSRFDSASHFRHLGLRFGYDGGISLARDKQRKIQNLFRFAFRRARRRWSRLRDPRKRAEALAAIAAETIARGVRNVAIVDYYLKHVTDEPQLRLLDRWLAEEVLSLIFGGHKKSHFRRLSFAELRSLGLPSLLHRRRLILRGEIESPFFIWQQQRAERALGRTVARL
jgi:retron-type reverse transcriptase